MRLRHIYCSKYYGGWGMEKKWLELKNEGVGKEYVKGKKMNHKRGKTLNVYFSCAAVC